MKHAPVKVATALVVAKETKKKAPKVRICKREGCGKTLTNKKQVVFCNAECRDLHLAVQMQATSKYDLRFANELFKEYLQQCKAGNEPTLIPTESSYIVIHNANPPSVHGYAEWLTDNDHVNVHEDTLRVWGQAHQEFAFCLHRIERIQKEFLFNKGLAGRYNSTIAKLGLSSNHGMVERTAVDSTHKFIGIVKHVYGEADRRDQLDNPHGTA